MAIPMATLLRQNLATATSLMYRTAAEDNLDKKTLMHKWGDPRTVMMGRSSIQLHRYELGAQNVEKQTEGQIGGGGNIGDETFTMTPAYYGDFIIVSDEVSMQTYSNYRMGSARSLGRRASLTIDAVHRNVFDAFKSNYTVTANAPYLTREVLAQVTSLMTEADVMGGEPDGLFGVVVSPLASFDLVYDTAAGGVMALTRTLAEKENRRSAIDAVVTETAGCRVYNSTLVTKPSSSKRRCYFFGANGYAYTNFSTRAPQFGMKANRNFNLIIHTAERGSLQDPTGRLRMSMAYRFTLGVSHLDTTDWRMRVVDVDVSLGS